MLGKDIHGFYYSKKIQDGKKTDYSGKKGSLWKAVKTAKEIDKKIIPNVQNGNNEEILTWDLPDRFP